MFLLESRTQNHIFLRDNGSLVEFLEPLDDLDVVELDILETVGKFNMHLPLLNDN